jgi:hypothetical protein
MGAVTFWHLRCFRQEDWSGKDDIYVTINGERVYSARIGEGGKYAINKTFRYKGDVARVRMYESDNLDDDDFLGEAIPLLGGHEMTFNQDGALYTITYEQLP